MIDLTKQVTLPELSTAVTFDQKGIINIITGLVILALVIILTLKITKHL